MNEYEVTVSHSRSLQTQENRTLILATEPARSDQEANLIFHEPTIGPDVGRWVARSMEETARAQATPIPQNHELDEPEAESEEGRHRLRWRRTCGRHWRWRRAS